MTRRKMLQVVTGQGLTVKMAPPPGLPLPALRLRRAWAVWARRVGLRWANDPPVPALRGPVDQGERAGDGEGTELR
jgi:hypothetical protein